MVRHLGIDKVGWDALIVGDGSGTDWKRGCGWAAVLIDHYGNYRMPFYGGWSTGTSHIAEIMPYLEALTWYAAGPGKLRKSDAVKDGDPSGYVKVHIVTDNSNVANQGNLSCERQSYPWLWDMVSGIERQGFLLKWHWLPRSKLGLNQLTDVLSRKCRVQMEKLLDEIAKEMGIPVEALPYAFNPDTEENPDAGLQVQDPSAGDRTSTS